VSYPQIGVRGLRRTAFAGPRRLPARDTCRRTLPRDHPVTATSSSSSTLRAFFEAAWYALA
jgi:hypothetical protein